MEMVDLEGRHLPASHASNQLVEILATVMVMVMVMVTVMVTTGRLSSSICHASQHEKLKFWQWPLTSQIKQAVKDEQFRFYSLVITSQYYLALKLTSV